MTKLPEIGTVAWQKELLKAINSGKCKYSLAKKPSDLQSFGSRNVQVRRLREAQLFVQSVLGA